jgi:hypothetical protein
MSARIALDSVGTALAAADNRPWSFAVEANEVEPVPANAAAADEGAARVAHSLPPLPLAPDPPGTMFAAAVMAGALPPRPTTPEEVFLRLGRAWQPPESQLHLADRQI